MMRLSEVYIYIWNEGSDASLVVGTPKKNA